MGANGSSTLKVDIIPQLFHFTQYGKPELEMFWLRGMKDLSETFALRLFEFEFLVNGKLVTLPICRHLFTKVFDTDKNGLVDKMEVMCLVCLCSSLSNAEKVEFLFELFNFNEKGYLVESEMSLLLLSITRVVNKIDSKFSQPAPPVWQHVIHLAYEHFANIDPDKKTMRKPELVQFAANLPQVTYYLDAFRGHASQVFVKMKKLQPVKDKSIVQKPQTADGKKWVDKFFPANESAITPLKDWECTGLPPYHFIRWRRRENIGSISAEDAYPLLFSHIRAVLRTMDKRKLFYGAGIIGYGYFKQGLLADRWILNGLSGIIKNPLLVDALFGATGQEDVVGRFSVRIFEGNGWRGIYIDDRIPCSPQCRPLFTQSSDNQECWPFIYEKAVAKYFGSYGAISLCAKRSDATMFALRMMSGGHVYRESSLDYEWKSVSSEVSSPEKDAHTYIVEILKEGSLVCFGRSDGMAFSQNTFSQSPRTAPPHGYVYPAVVAYTDEKGYKFIKIRDAFNEYMPFVGEYRNTNPDYIHDDRVKVDERSGHCNTVNIAVEKITDLFDTMFIVRFPDAVRPLTEKMGLVPWRTDYLKMRSRGKTNPAKFLLKVIGHHCDYKPPKEQEISLRLSKLKEQQLKEMTVSEDIVSQEMDADFDFDRPRVFPTAERKRNIIPVQLSEEQAKLEQKKEQIRKELIPMDVCITASSSCPWSVAGAAEAGAKIRIRVVPSMATIKYLRIIKKKKEEIEADKLAKIAEAEARMKALLAAEDEDSVVVDDEEDDGEGAEEKAKGEEEGEDGDKKPGTARSNASKNSNKSELSESDEESSEEDSDSDESSEQVDEALERRLEIARKERLLELEWFEVRDSAEQCWLSKNVKLYPGEYFILVDVSFDMSPAKLYHLASPKDRSECPWLDGRPLEVNKVWLQTTSTCTYQVKALHNTSQLPKHGMSVTSVTMKEQKWPFCLENQEETSSRALTSMMSDLRVQVNMAGVKFLTMAKDFKNNYRQKIKLYRQYLAEKEAEAKAYAEKLAQIERLEQERLDEERQMRAYREREAKIKLEKQRAAKFAAKRSSAKGKAVEGSAPKDDAK